MRKVVHVTPKPNYTLAVTFDDGTFGEISIADRLFGPMFEPLKDPEYFALASVDSFGAIVWPNEADLAPDALFRKITDR